MNSEQACAVDACGRKRHARGLCKMHYKRLAATGPLDPLPLPYSQGNVDGFWGRVNRDADCWEWKGSKTAAGYGNLRLPGGRNGYAHRVAYELTCGPIPEGKVLDHLCRNRGCVNPEHLEPVDQYENVMRGATPYGPHRPTCRAGHDITKPENVYTRPSGSSLCRVCARAQENKRREARRAKKK